MEPLTPPPIEVAPALDADLPELAELAAQTFPLACPPSTSTANVTAFIAENLSLSRFRDYLADADRTLLAARSDGPAGRMLGYAMLIRGVADDADVQRAVTLRPAVEVSKMYVLPDGHGRGISAALMSASLERAKSTGAAAAWLGVNQENQRAQRFYSKHGFLISGTKTFRLGDANENDYVMTRPL